MQTVEAGVLYFALVFGAGFALGVVRTQWVVPRVGARKAELMEMPIMLAVTILAARWTVLRLGVPSLLSARLGMGCIALALMLVAEFGFVLWIRSLSIKDYLATRDPVSGAVYYAMLVVFAAMPLLVARK
jgi:type IV secretory pathway TrbD component